ncbi:MAG: hypothetical protein IJY81_04525, partial [Lachnospiraceae bacterium]|nr:hypothetical protein [Lachnospiraceae bacterium]
LQKQLDAYIRINEALTLYMSELALLDAERFKEETERCNKMIELLEKAESEDALNVVLCNEYRALGFELPYNGEFDDFMNDNDSTLVFK